MRFGEPVDLGWVFRPALPGGGTDRAAQHAGKAVHSVGNRTDVNGRVEVVLVDGERVRAHRHELSPG